MSRSALFEQTCQGRVGVAPWFTRRRGDAEGSRSLTTRCNPSLSVLPPKLMSSPTHLFVSRRWVRSCLLCTGAHRRPTRALGDVVEVAHGAEPRAVSRSLELSAAAEPSAAAVFIH